MSINDRDFDWRCIYSAGFGDRCECFCGNFSLSIEMILFFLLKLSVFQTEYGIFLLKLINSSELLLLIIALSLLIIEISYSNPKILYFSSKMFFLHQKKCRFLRLILLISKKNCYLTTEISYCSILESR